MFKVIGHDQREYGPITADQIREWIRHGRLNANSRVQPVGATDWKPLSEYSEFANDVAVMAGPPPVPVAGVPALPTGQKTSRMAVASLILGVLGLFTCGITAVVGVILGPIALTRINRSNGHMGGRGLAIAGTVISGIFLIMIPISLAMFLPAMAKAKTKAGGIRCMNNAKQLCLGVMMYAVDHKDSLPTPATWGDQLMGYIPNSVTFQCPDTKDGKRANFAFNARLNGKKTSDLTNPLQTVILFETDGGWNVSGGPELLLRNPRHGNTVIVGFADGHVEMVPTGRVNTLRWDP